MSYWRQQLSTQMDTNRSDEDIDDALITDSVKKLLSDSDGTNYDLAADILSSNSSTSGNVNQLQHSGATVQEGMDLVDALDTLVQHLSRESNTNNNSNKELIDSNSLLLTPFDVVIMDHNYCQPVFVRPVTDLNTTPVITQSVPEVTKPSFETTTKPLTNLMPMPSPVPSPNTLVLTTSAPTTPTSSLSPVHCISGNKSPKTPTASRRSQRQIDKIEKSVLEKIKAENQEMLKREKESMESPNKIKSEPIDDNKDVDESELVIDFDDKKEKTNNNSNNKKRLKKTKLQTDEITNKKPRMEKQEIHDNIAKEDVNASTDKHETDELEDVIAALSAVTDSDADKSSSIGRSQRNRRKPKRWDDDEVEVDFSGQLGILAQEQQLLQQHNQTKQESDSQLDLKVDEEVDKDLVLENKTDVNHEKKIKANESQLSSDEAVNDDEEDSGSDFGSEDDPDKLWCVCRQPHDDRFMIGCDSCEEWFHGKCVNVTKQQGRQMEKAKQEWLCSVCTKGITDGMTRADLKRIADQKRTKLEAEERIRAQTKRAAKEKFLKKEKSREMAKIRDKRESIDVKRREQKPEKEKNVPKKLQMQPKKRESIVKTEDESEKLKKLIKSSKKDLNKKHQLMGKKLSKANASNKSTKSPLSQEFDTISKVVPIVRKPEVKKKHKDAIDPSVQDLFKAEPIKKTSVTTPTTPTTPSTPGGPPFQRKSIDRRTSTSVMIERLCPSGCGKMIKSETSIYCNEECIEVHVSETLKLLRIARKEKGETSAKNKDIDRRVVVVEKSSGRLLSGKDGILEKEVLDYIKINPTFEVFRPTNVKDKKKEETVAKTAPISPIKGSSPKKEDKRTPIGRSNSRSGESEGPDPIRANVRTSLKETLITRCKEVNETSIQSDEIRKIANKIEDELFKLFNKDTSGKYRNKYRSLIFNLKDAKNQGLFRKVVNGKISPERLVQMSAEELASSELAKWREREKISMLEMIKRDAADKVHQVIVKKTHKGEELIESVIVNDTTNEPKSGDGKSSTPTSVPNTGVSTILADLMGSSAADTTAQHRTHLFSNNCRICTKQQLSDDSKQEVVNKQSKQSSSGQREEQSRPTPKRVRVELETANKILLEAAKLSSNAKASVDDDDSAEAPSSTLCLSSPEVPSSSSSSRPIWKGNVFMQDVAKFAANAVKVSGAVTEYLPQDVSEQITVCGRIAPEQVLDYVKKLKYSSRTEIGIIKFVSSREERVGYDAFFNYLDSRGRYGVVGSTGKLLKDFYILPLPKNGDVPEVLLPFDGPGLDKKSMRPNLLLGILIRSKKPVASQAPQSSSTSQTKSKTSNTSSNSTDRSYTPPPKNASSQSSPDDNKDSGDVSYTPPRITSKTNKSNKAAKKAAVDDDEPYDPEEADLSNSNSLPSSTSSIQELMDQIAKSSNPVEMTSSVLSAIANSSNFELQRRLLDQLTAKVEEQKRQLEEQKLEAEAHFASNNSSNTSSVIPGLDGQFGSLKDIKIPDNLQDILSSVREKTHEIEQQQERLKAVAASGFKFDDPIVKNFGTKKATEETLEESSERTPDTEPMDLDEDVTSNKSNIIEVNTPLNNASVEATAGPQTSDPRLRSKKQTPLPSISQETGGDAQVAAMTADELMQKAREQMAALAQMEKTKDKPSPKIKIEWKKKK